jgi:integrase
LYSFLYFPAVVMAKKVDKFLLQRGRQWYFWRPIPKHIRHLFPSESGRPLDKVAKPLGPNYDVAKPAAAMMEAACAAVFAQIEAGVITSPEAAKAALQRGPAVDDEGNPILPGERAGDSYRRYADAVREIDRRLALERQALLFEAFGHSGDQEQPAAPAALPAPVAAFPTSAALPAPIAGGETVSQAAEAWYAELMRDKSTAPRETTLDGHKRRAQAFINAVGDVPLTDVTGIMASDFLTALKVSKRTRNNYRDTLNYIFKYAAKRGRFSKAEEDNPFHDQRSKKVGKSSYVPFTIPELQTLFKALPREIKPAKHSPDTALPWVALIALYTGMRLEEIAQLTTADIRKENANGATVTIIDVHNGGENKLKNEPSVRLIPIHSELVRLGLLDYVKALKPGPLFPGLVRRESKGGKVGARLGELFRKKLIALGIKREGLCFHSLRHTVTSAFDAAAVPQSDAARVLGHAVEGESYSTYSQPGPGLKRVAAVVEQITYPGLKVA